jgi:hypothetical protein
LGAGPRRTLTKLRLNRRQAHLNVAQLGELFFKVLYSLQEASLAIRKGRLVIALR